MAVTRRILGTDPGSRVTGYGIIDVTGQEVRYVDSGCIRLADEAMRSEEHTSELQSR